jgi:hypothetical protein
MVTKTILSWPRCRFPKMLSIFLNAAVLILALNGLRLSAQSLTTGEVVGVITDATSAVIPGVSVSLKSLDTGSQQDSMTNEQGQFRFPLLRPGHYSVSVAKSGFKPVESRFEVGVGDTTTANLHLEVGENTTTVEVTESLPLMSTEASANTTFTQSQVELLPSAGGDITNIAFTAPGVVVNSTGGYGNFTMNGLPATANLYTVNGENNMDPYFNINNSGATNLTLGQNELQEASIIANPYAGEYGQLAGAQVTYVTKSGTNKFHGNAQYWWNGRFLNANDWFNNSCLYGCSPRPFANDNQYATSLGGPVFKNKTFFFVNFEGLRFVLPSVVSATIPTTAFANAVLNNLKNVQPNEVSAYQSMFNLYANAPGAAGAQTLLGSNVSSACKSLVLPGFNGATQGCDARFESSPSALASEWFLSGRVDQRVGDKDSMFYRYKLDHGTQPSYLDPISSKFDAISQQPSWDNQFQETHIFGATSTNSFNASLSHYVAQFQQNYQLASSTFPDRIITSGAVDFTGFNPISSFPQGRNITQYQIFDDFSIVKGKHSIKVGENFRRYDVSDHNFFYNSPAIYFGYTTNGLQNFANGLAYQYRKSLNLASDVPVATWGLGFYGQDEWSVSSKLKVTLALRFERNSNPVCQFNCFANFKGPWNTLASVTNAAPGSVPYSSDIAYNQHQAYPGVDAISPSPRAGFSYSPRSNNKMVISGGFGIFYDSPAAGLVDDLLGNPPVAVAIRVRPSKGTLPFDPAGGAATWAASANAFSITKTYSQISSALTALGSSFAAPAVTAISGTIHNPEIQEWNFQIQQELTRSLALVANYSGNHGVKELYSNAWHNAYDQYGLYPGVPGISASVPVANYGTVTTIQNGALSNYNGLSVSVRKHMSHGFVANFNYTWSHTIDETSNGGLFTYGDSVLGQINPLSLRANNYGNADYDIRNNFNGDFVYQPSVHTGHKYMDSLLGGWQIAGKIFWRSGLPFSVSDGNSAFGNGGGAIFGTPLTSKGLQTSCGEAATTTPCLNAAGFVDASAASFNNFTAWSPQNRNTFRGPHLFNMDANLFRTFTIAERLKFAVGLQAFNVLNHPNFGQPDATLGDSTFGQITGMAGVPTSPYGSGLGYDASPRTVQLTGKITF